MTRRAAAQQIGEVQKLHPHELHNLLDRIQQTYLPSNTWETRIAAGQTIEAILKNVPKWCPVPLVGVVASDGEEGTEESPGSLLSFDAFDLQVVITDGSRLMGSEGLEFDFSADDSNQSTGVTREESLVRQQKLINEKLGLTRGITIDQIITLDDMKVEDVKPPVEQVNLKSVQDIFKQQSMAAASTAALGMSCREQNRARRKARQTPIVTSSTGPVPPSPSAHSNGSNSSNSSGGGGGGSKTVGKDEPLAKKIKMEPNNSENGKSPTLNSGGNNHKSKPSAAVPDGTGSWSDGATSWPFKQFCTKLVADLFNPRWEVRHGAATGLRELFKLHVDGAGKRSHLTKVSHLLGKNLLLVYILTFHCVFFF